MNKIFTQPSGPVAKQTNKQAIARVLGLKQSQVAILSPGLVVNAFSVLFDPTTQLSFFRGTATGTVSSWLVTNNELTLVTDSGSHTCVITDLETRLASSTLPGSSLVSTKLGKNIEQAVRAASAASSALFPRLTNKLTAYRHGTEGYQTQFNMYGFGSSVGNGATIGGNTSENTPIAKFFEYFQASVNKAGIYPMAYSNKSVDGSAINHFLTTAWPAVVSEGVYPDLALFIYGMNDFPSAQYNSGATFGENGFKQRLRQAVRLVQEAGGDVVIVTSPHPRLEVYSWSLPPTIDMIWPSYSPKPVADESLKPPVSQSVVDIDWNGTTIQAGVRFLRGNDAMRQIAVEMGCVLIDAEKYWFDAVAKYGEAALFDTVPNIQIVHPNLLGHQSSYHQAFKDFFDNVDKSGWIAPAPAHNNLFDVGGSALYPQPKTADVDLMANGVRVNAFINRDQFARPLFTQDQTGLITRTAYTSQAPTVSSPGYSLNWTEMHSRTKGLYAAGETQAIPIANRTSVRVLIDAWTSALTGWSQFVELLVTNREGVVQYTVIGNHDFTPVAGSGSESTGQGGSRLFTLSTGNGTLIVNIATANTTLKYKVEGFGV